MLYSAFRIGLQISKYSTIPALVLAVAVPVGMSILLARSQQRGEVLAHNQQDRVLCIAASAAVTLGMFHFLLIFLPGSLVREYSRIFGFGPIEILAQTLIAPPNIDRLKLVLSALMLLLGSVLAGRGVYWVMQDGKLLRDRLDQWKSPIPRREGLGSAHLCTPHEFRRFTFEDEQGLTFRGAFWGQSGWSKKIRRLDDGKRGLCLSSEDLARGILAIGGPGSGKTQSVVLPAIADWMLAGRSMIIVDPQNELTAHINRLAAVTGHHVIIHDPVSALSPRFNLSSHISDPSEARTIADMLLPAPDNGSSGFVWQESVQSLLAACLLRFDNVGDILIALADIRRLARKLSENKDDAALLATPFLVSMKSDGILATQIVASLAATLTGWADETVRASTAATDFAASSLMERPTTIVLTCPGRQRGTYARYLGTVLRKLMLDLDRIGEDNGGPMPAPVAVVLDEFPTLGKLDNLVTDVNLVRKRHIAVLIAAQTIGQFHMIYGSPTTASLLAGLATQIIFGGCDQETAELFSRASGLATERLPVRFGQPPQIRQRSLLTPDEIQTPARGNATIFARYVTEAHASQVILFARLLRLYERVDWQDRPAGIPVRDVIVTPGG